MTTTPGAAESNFSNALGAHGAVQAQVDGFTVAVEYGDSTHVMESFKFGTSRILRLS